MTERDDARTALAQVAQCRSAMGTRVVAPPWYHPSLALLAGSFVAIGAIDRVWVFAVAAVAFGIGCGVLMAAYRSATGVWVQYSTGVPAAWGTGTAAVFVASWACAYLVSVTTGFRAAFVVAGVVSAAAILVGGTAADRAYAELHRADQATPGSA